MIAKHECGGTILVGGFGDQAHTYCDRCGAFAYGEVDSLPTGTDKEANRAAWDAGEDRSPEATEATKFAIIKSGPPYAGGDYGVWGEYPTLHEALDAWQGGIQGSTRSLDHQIVAIEGGRIRPLTDAECQEILALR